MTMSLGPNTGLLVDGALGEQHFANLMAQFRGHDALIQCHVKDKDLTTPPASPVNGDMYIVAASPTGAWVGQAGKLAYYYVIPANGSNGATGTSGWQFFTPRKGWRTHVEDENADYQYNGSAWVIASSGGGGGSVTQCIPIACSDEVTALTSGAAKVTFRMPYAFTLSAVRASLTTPQTSGSILTVDINEGGTSILSTKITIDNTEKTSTTAAAAAVISDSSIADDAEITIDIDQIGDGTAKGLKVYLIGVPA